MKLMGSILSRNRCYTAGKKIKVRGLMLHSIGCPQPRASVLIDSWDNPSHNTCVHGFIDGEDGTVYQTLPWDHRAWHCGGGAKGSGNDTHIGVEMCEPACIKYTKGANFVCSDMVAAKAVVERTYSAAVELFAMLCKDFGLDPLADGVVISHREGHSRGIASNHGDPEHLWSQLGTGYTMDGFRKAVKAAMLEPAYPEVSVEGTKIMGIASATVEQMISYIKKKDPDVVQSVIDMIPLYLSEGEAEGVRGDIAFAQSCLETGNFGFSGSAVTLDQNNFCGMGVTSNGMKGNSFDTPQLGIRAQVQHLKAYASTDALENACVDPRFKYVARGCAGYVEWLGQKENPQGYGWATGAGYGEKILAILNGILACDPGAVLVPPHEPEVWYRVRRTWDDTVSQKGAFKTLENARACADENPGYTVYDQAGKALYPGGTAPLPFLVRVDTSYLNIRKGPGTDHAKTGRYTGMGTFTIVEVQSGEGSDLGWGLLKSYADTRDGWISLDIAERV